MENVANAVFGQVAGPGRNCAADIEGSVRPQFPLNCLAGGAPKRTGRTCGKHRTLIPRRHDRLNRLLHQIANRDRDQRTTKANAIITR